MSMNEASDNDPRGPVGAIVTGATSGIGLAIARGLAREGFSLVLAARREQRLAEVASGLEGEFGVRAVPVAADMSRAEAVDALVEAAFEALPGIGVLVNNAAVGELVPIEQSDAGLMERTLRANVVGPGQAIHRVWSRFVDQGAGRIINISSWATRDPFPGFFAYGASKAAVESMVRSCRNEGHEKGIRAFAIAPGAVETPMLRSIVDESAVPRSACLAPEEVAAVVVECALGKRDEDSGRTIYMRRVPEGGRVEYDVV